ncbi:serine hydrolase [Streptomyces sp. NPDC094472]|uniref:serine hydrolase domain-containing protein n=1 Tax=Streptomyces sp. NPDC094472 TaxID=3155080 RepID=UPI003322EAB5
MFTRRSNSTARTSTSTPSKRRSARSMVAAMAVLGSLAVGGPLAYAGTQDATRKAAVHNDAVQKAADSLVREDGFTAALAAVDNGDGQVRDYTAGVGDLTTGEDVPVNGRVRAGSNTKAFVSAVVLQLVGEGKVKLDAPIETYLPGLVRGEGIDGNKITVRQLLQHTSGLPDFVRFMEPNAFTARNTYTEPRELLDTARAPPQGLRHRPGRSRARRHHQAGPLQGPGRRTAPVRTPEGHAARHGPGGHGGLQVAPRPRAGPSRPSRVTPQSPGPTAWGSRMAGSPRRDRARCDKNPAP